MATGAQDPRPAVIMDAALREIVDRIVAGFPRGGSSCSVRGHGERRPPTAMWTLFVVTDRPGSRRQQAVAIDLALADIPAAKDVLVVGLDDLERDRDVVGTIAYPAWREGIVLYDRAA